METINQGGALSHVWGTVLTTIHSMGYMTFAIIVIVNIVLYRLHPVLGFLGTLFLFALLTGIIH